MSDSELEDVVEAVEGGGGSGDEGGEVVEAIPVVVAPPVRADPFPILRPELVEAINKERRQAG